jgi:hypothetical protein
MTAKNSVPTTDLAHIARLEAIADDEDNRHDWAQADTDALEWALAQIAELRRVQPILRRADAAPEMFEALGKIANVSIYGPHVSAKEGFLAAIEALDAVRLIARNARNARNAINKATETET